MTTPETTAASGRYIRCSNATSRMGTILEVGARMARNHSPRNPHVGRRIKAQIVAPNRAAMAIAPGTTSQADRAIGQA